MQSDQDMVFHYTSAAVMLSIVTERTLWATHIDCLNDRFEGTLPSKVLKWIIKNPEVYLRGFQTCRKHIDALAKSLDTGKYAFTTSFSEHKNSLPQFRMYCPPAGGYAIGFPRDYLAAAGTFVKCDYSKENILSWAKDYALRFLKHAAQLDDDTINHVDLFARVAGLHPYISERIEASLNFKSEEFIYEREHRLIVDQGPILYRPSPDNNIVVPYRTLELSNEEVSVAIVSGPNREPGLVGLSYVSLCQAAHAVGTKWNIRQMAYEYGFRT